MTYTYKNVERKQIKTASGAKCVINIVNLNEVFERKTSGFEHFGVSVPAEELNRRTIMCGIDSLGVVYGYNQPDTWGDGVLLNYTSGSSPATQVLGIPQKIGANPNYYNVSNSTIDRCIVFSCLFRDANGDYFFEGHQNVISPQDGAYITKFPTGDSYGEWYDPNATGSLIFSRQTSAGWIQNGINVGNAIMRYAQPEDLDPYSDIDGESDIPGGGSISVPGAPPESATATGIVGLFAPTAYQMQQLADFMWTDFGGQGQTTEEILEEIVQALKRTISNPLDYILGLNIIPSQGLSIGSSQTIKFGYVSSNVSMPRLSSQYFTVDCGTLSFDTLCGDTFLDYAPYSKFQIYLPYIGFREVNANDFVGHTIGVIYKGDVVSGAVTAYITKDGSVMYQYSGSCAVNIPLSSDNWGATISAAINVATTIVTGGLSGGTAGAATNALKGAANVAANPSLLSPSVSHSGAVSGSAGALGVQIPFIIREAVRFHSTAYFNTVSGYPSHIYEYIGNLTGYTTVLDVNLHGFSATVEEMNEIKSLLQGGVIL